MGVSNSDGYIFSKSGPSNLKSIDWTDLSHRTAVAASLVEGVYILTRLGPNLGAESWWESFNFTMLEKLEDHRDVIYGAIFEYKDTHLESSPRYVIAFRGTILKWKTCADIKNDIYIAFDKLHRRPNVVQAIERVEYFVEKHNNKDVWLAGHSLGAAIALLAGKTMIRKSGIPLETYVFNPPISDIPLSLMTDNRFLKTASRMCWTLGKVPLVWGHQEQNQEEDTKIGSWRPHLFLNPADPVCSEFIGYFSNKKLMSRIGLSKIAEKAERYTIRSHLFGTSGERLHILPSACTIVNKMVKPTNKMVAHGLRQWWETKQDARKWEISFHG